MMACSHPEVNTLACKDCHEITKPRFRFGDTHFCARCALERGLLTSEEITAILKSNKWRNDLAKIDPSWRFW